jgi:hypothetical protein
MARLFVFSDNLAARVELIRDLLSGEWRAYCAGCSPAHDPRSDLLRDLHERFNLADAEQEAEQHVDECRRCADPGCRTAGRHDVGHRCRKP